MGRAVIEADPSLFPRDVSFPRRLEGGKVVMENARQVGEAHVVEDGRLKEVVVFYDGHNPYIPGGEFIFSGFTGKPETARREDLSIPA